MNSFIIPLPKEFSFEHCVAFLMRSPHELLHTCIDSYIFKLLQIGDKKILLKVYPGDAGMLNIDLLNTPVTEETRIILEQYIREWFDLDTDLGPFYKMATGDKILKELVRKFYGYRIVGQPDLFESLVWAVIGQQINLPFAYTLKQRFVQQFGEHLHFEGAVHYLFPAAKLVASLTDNDLLPLQFSRQKSRYTIGIAEAFSSNVISTEALRKLPFHEAKEQLMKIKGVGNWTANYALMKTYRHPNAFPLEDAGLHQAIRNQLKLSRKPTIKEVETLFKKYKGWEAYATLYLWKSL